LAVQTEPGAGFHLKRLQLTSPRSRKHTKGVYKGNPAGSGSKQSTKSVKRKRGRQPEEQERTSNGCQRFTHSNPRSSKPTKKARDPTGSGTNNQPKAGRDKEKGNLKSRKEPALDADDLPVEHQEATNQPKD
jgi:hypothetical protein